MKKHIFKEYYKKYIQEGYSVIPDKYMKKIPAIKGWSDYCFKLPTKEELDSWCNNFEESNIAVCLGKASGIVALDIDADDQEILDIILPILPESPVVKVGSKGETRFFRYTGEATDILKHNGQVVVEILSSNKKTTLPPSIHPNGSSYKWVDGDLFSVDKSSLPILPPALFSHLQSKLKLSFPNLEVTGANKSLNGRNDALSSFLGNLILQGKTVDEVIAEMIKYDEANHDVPLFSDPEEMRHTEKYSNALMFYTNHLNTINTKRFRENKMYETPVMQAVVDKDLINEVRGKKQLGQVGQRKVNLELPLVPGVLGSIISNILSNSYIKQPSLAFGAALTLMSTLVSRKLVFQGMSPNLYVLNVSPSGCVDADTEYLSESGWKKISSYNKMDKVLQYDMDTGEATFVVPLEYVCLPEIELIHIESERGAVNQTLSKEHRVCYKQPKSDKWEVGRAEELFKDKSFKGVFETTFKYSGEGVPFTTEELRLQVAFLADGCIPERGTPNIHIKKNRKKERLEKLLKEANVDFSVVTYEDGYSRYRFQPPILTKEYPKEFYKCSKNQLETICDEVQYWDGYKRSFSSNNKEDVDFIQFAFASTGKRSTIAVDEREGRNTNYSVTYTKNSSLVGLGSNPIITKVQAKYNKKYCFKVPSDTLVLRRKGRIFITKNSGKDAPQKVVKELLMDIGAESLLGAGDYVSDASLVDSLEVRPTRLDIMDEAGGILRSMSSGKNSYDGKMADILAELYTASNSKYLGRALAEGNKGSCYRPNVNILASTTPTGFSEGINITSIEKGLMGRFLIFTGDAHKKAERLRSFPRLGTAQMNHLRWWYGYRPEESDTNKVINGIPQNYTELKATPEAEEKLDIIFDEFDSIRCNAHPSDILLPIIARLYQQMVKIVIISAASRIAYDVPVIDVMDVDFGYRTIKYYYSYIREVISRNVFTNNTEKNTIKVLNIIKDAGGEISQSELTKKTRSMNKRDRDQVINDLIDSDQVIRDIVTKSRKSTTVYILNEGEE